MAERFIGIAFVGTSAYYPDMLFRAWKIDLEIDGKYHDHGKRKEIDPVRDQAFRENGYTVIRIKNEDLAVNVAFWERLIETLSSHKERGKGGSLDAVVGQLEEMVAEEREDWLNVTL